MTSDPSDASEQRRASHELLERGGAKLVNDALRMIAEDPDAEPVGLALEPGAKLAVAMTAAIERATGGDLSGQSVISVIPRRVADAILGADAERAWEWHAQVEEHAGRPLLLMIALTRDGMRLGARPLAPAE